MTYWTDKRVVVTGGGGFLGTHVVEKLRQAGCRSLFVVRSRDFDLTKEADVVRLFEELQGGAGGWPTPANGRQSAADVLIHLAGLVGGIGANAARPAQFFYHNLMMGTLTLHHAWKSGVTKAVASGAGCGYPEHAPLPLAEASFWDGFPQEESAPYSLAKRMLHIQSVAYWQQHRFPVVVAVPGNIYGPYDNFDLENAHVVPSLVRKFVDAVEDRHQEVTVWGSGRPTRDFVYAGDVAEGILRAAEVYDEPQLVNLASGVETSVRTVVDTLAELTGFDGEITWDADRHDGQSRRVFDVSKARRELDFAPRTSLREGLRQTMDWYRRNHAEARKVLSFSA